MKTIQMDEIYIEFPRSASPASLSKERYKGRIDIDHLNFLFDNFADKVFGFIICHKYSYSTAEKVLIQVFSHTWNHIKSFGKEERPLYKLLVIAAQFINKHAVVKYSHQSRAYTLPGPKAT